MPEIWSWLGIVAVSGVVIWAWSVMAGVAYFMAREGIDNRAYRRKVHEAQLNRYLKGEIQPTKDGFVPAKVNR